MARQSSKGQSKVAAPSNKKFSSRKLIVTAICLIAGVVIDLYTQRGLSQNLLTLMIAIIGLYTGGNVVAKAFTRPKGTQGADPRVDAIIQHLQGVTSTLSQVEQAQQQFSAHLSGALDAVSKVQTQVELANKRVSAVLSNGGVSNG